jgi:hypothetical protein
VQHARNAPTPLVRALVAETTALARTQRLGAAVEKRAMCRALRSRVVVICAGVALWFGGAEKSAPLLRRAALST